MQKQLCCASILLYALLTWAGAAKADQAEYVTKDQAERAAVLLKDKGEIKHHCADCDDKSTRPETIKTIEAAPVGDGKNWEVKLNGKGIDLAYVYFKNADGQWKNVAIELAIPVEDVPPILLSGPPVFTEDDLKQSTTSPQTSGEFLTRGSQWFRNRNWDKAIADFNESLKMREDNATAYLMRGTTQINKKNFEAALADLNKALQLDKSEYLTHFRLAELYKAQNKTAESDKERQTGSDLLKAQAVPRTAQGFVERGQYFEERGYTDDSITYYGEAIKLEANYAPAYEKRGDLYSYTSKYEEAIADYNRFIELEPQRVMSYVRRAEILELAELFSKDKKDYSPELLRDYSETIKHADAFQWNTAPLLRAYESRAALHAYKNTDLDKAIADYSSALRLDPRDGLLYFFRGQLWSIKKNYDKAIRDFDYALVLNPKAIGNLNERGLAYKELKLMSNATADFTKAIELDSKYVPPLFHRGTIYLNNGENDKAIDDLTKALALAKNGAYFNNRGIAYFNKKEWDKAIADFDEAIKLNAKNVDTWNNRGVAYNAKSELDKAIADYTQAIALDANFIRAYKNRAVVYRKQNKIELAEADEKKAQELKGKTATPATATPPAKNLDDEDDFLF